LIKGGAVKYTGQDDLPFPVLLRLWNDSKRIRELFPEVRGQGAHQRNERPVPRPSRTSSPSALQEVQGTVERALDLDESYDKFLQKEAGRAGVS